MSTPTISDARTAVDIMQPVIGAALDRLATVDIDEHQVVAYDIAHGAAAVAAAANLLAYGALGEDEGRLTIAFVADVAHDLATASLAAKKTGASSADRSTDPRLHDRRAGFLASLADGAPSHLDEDMALAAETFRRLRMTRSRLTPNTCTAPTPMCPSSHHRSCRTRHFGFGPRRARRVR